MIRIVASVLALLLAAPAASAVSFAPAGVDLVGPADCCCPDESSDKPTPPQVERPCCCELRPLAPGTEAPDVSAVIDRQLPTPAAPLATMPHGPPRVPSSVHPAGHSNARAPPPTESLFAQRTSLLL